MASCVRECGKVFIVVCCMLALVMLPVVPARAATLTDAESASLLAQLTVLLAQLRSLLPATAPAYGLTSGTEVVITVANDTELYNALLNVKGGEILKLAPGKYSSITIYKKTTTSANDDRIGVGAVYKTKVTPVLTAPVTVTSADLNNRAVVQSLELTNSEKWRFVGLSFRPSPKQKAVAFTTDDFAFINNDISSGDATNWTDTDWLNNAGDAIDGSSYDKTYSRPRNEIAYNYLKNVHLGINAGSNAYVHHNVVRGFSMDSSRCNDNCVFENNIFTEEARVDGNHPDAFQSFTKDVSGGTVGAGNNVNTVLRYNTMVTNMHKQAAPDSFQGVGMFDGTFENWVIENNLIINDHEHGISVYGPINSVIRNNAGFTYSTEINKDGRGLIRFFNHKDGRPPVGSTMSGNISSNLPTTGNGVTVTSHTVAKVADYDKYFVDYRNHDFTLKPGSIPFAVGANIDPAKLAPEPYATPGSAISLAGYGTQSSYPLPPSVPKVPAPTVTLTSATAALATGAATTLTWSSTNATTCTASGAWTGSKSLSGSESTGVQTTAGTQTFKITCTGGGGSLSKSANIVVTGATVPTSTVNQASLPTLTLSAALTTLTTGSSTTLTWSTTGATTCTASGNWTGTKSTGGSEATGAQTTTGTKTYTLTCTGTGGTVAKTVNVVVATPPPAGNTTPPPTLTMTISQTTLTLGSSATIAWNTTNATTCTASGAWSGSKAVNGTETNTQTTTGTKTLTLTCTGVGGTLAKSVNITVNAVVTTEPGTTSGGSSSGGSSSGSSSGGSSSGSSSRGGTTTVAGATTTPTVVTTGPTVVITTDRVNVRATGGGLILGLQPTGTSGTIDTTKTKQTATGHTWVYVDFTTGVDGWVASEYLSGSIITPTMTTAEKIAILTQQLQILIQLLATLQGH